MYRILISKIVELVYRYNKIYSINQEYIYTTRASARERAKQKILNK